MGSYRTKEEDVDKISTSVYITNFPESTSAKELFQVCKQYGHVVDSFILNKRSKIGKRFGFIKFINVFSEERLINNLCTVWINRFKLHANIARFNRSTGKKEGNGIKKPFVNSAPTVKEVSVGKSGHDKSYIGAFKGDNKMETEVKTSEHSIVLGDECVLSKNIAKSLFGRVKEFASLANLKRALGNKGFMDIVIKYMGELWVMMEFKSDETILKFKESVSVMSWFSQVIDGTNEFEVEGRIVRVEVEVEVEGVPFRLWIDNTFTRIVNKWGKLLDVDDQDETCFHSKRLCIYIKAGKSIREDFKIIHRGKPYWIRAIETPGWVPDFSDESDDEDNNSLEAKIGETDGKHSEKKMENSEDPFNIYPLLNRNKHSEKKDNEPENSLKYPPGFTPSARSGDDVRPVNKCDTNDEFSVCCEENNVKGSGNGSIASGHFKVSGVPKTGGSMISLLEEVAKVGQMNLLSLNIQGLAQKAKKIRGHWRLTGKNMMIIAVYAPQESKEKQSLWGFLQQEIGKWNGDVIIMGDFNEVRVKSDRFGSHFNPYAAQRFNSFISESGLVEVNLGGCCFTWCHKSATKMRKLDRYDYGPTPFRFFHHWLEMDGFNAFVEDTWKNSHRVGHNALSSLMSKLRVLKKQIRLWNKTNMGFRTNEQINLKKKLEDIDSTIDSGFGNEVLINSRLDIIHQIQKLDILDSKERAQKAKITWAIEGDENSGFFHDFPNQISADQHVYLESEVTNAEIKKAVWECGIDKASDPDGFTFGFFRHFWHLVDMEVFEAVMYFFTYSDLPKGCNSSFIALILKIPNANLVKDFKPISLIGSIYKIIAKILTNRLVGVLGGIINEVQSDFIKDRQILDGPFILNEVMSWCKRKKKQTLLFKVDFEKAYDSVRWDFLDDVLNKFGFGEKWRNWIRCCLHSLKGSIIVNGSPSDEFQFGKGLKQGDPLSPFLFLLVMETLHISFQRVVDAGLYQGLKINMSKSKIMGIDVEAEVKVMEEKGISLMSFMKKKLGNGFSTLFWEEGWCEGGKLKDRFPRAYALENVKQITVGQKLAQPCIYHSFRRDPSGGMEKSQVEALTCLV
nr:RNA-directed DNA polymerase, eukaryota [Tanacetum cinerariifolium]